MKKKTIASLLICTITLLAVVPARNFSQTLNKSSVGQIEKQSDDIQANPKPDELKNYLYKEMAKNNAGVLSPSVVKRLEKKMLEPQTTTKSGFSKKQVILVAVIVVVIVALAAIAAHNGWEPSVDCVEEPFHPSCDR